jgi:hypothetical protein
MEANCVDILNSTLKLLFMQFRPTKMHLQFEIPENLRNNLMLVHKLGQRPFNIVVRVLCQIIERLLKLLVRHYMVHDGRVLSDKSKAGVVGEKKHAIGK